MIAVREFSSGAECIAHAQALRQKFYRQQRKVKAVAAPEPKIEAPSVPVELIVKDRPNKKIPSPPRRLTVRRDLNIWERFPTDFNAHVVAYRRYLLQKEMQAANQNEDLVLEDRKPISEIVNEVLRKFPGITWDDIKSRRRNDKFVKPRQIIAYEIHRQRKDLSYPSIGRIMGGRDHTTVLHSVRKIESMKAAAGALIR